jgi:hypothetical protein
MEIMDDHAPGRKVMRRPSERRDVYWVASPAAVRAGYRPKTVTLKQDPGEVQAPPEVALRCRQMWSEMLEFLAGTERVGTRSPVGTIAWLADIYSADDDGPYRRIRPATKIGYDKSLAIIRQTVGGRRIDTVTSNDVRKWFRGWGRAGADGELANPRRAYGCVQLLRIVVKYGKGLRNAACRDLSEILTETEFPAPRARRQTMSSEQVAAFIVAAHAAGNPSMARAIAIQFACSLRQKDIVGEWLRAETGRQWLSGLLWGEHVKPDWHLEKPTSKSNFEEVAEFDLRLAPIVMQELSTVLTTSRIGPVIIDERRGLPYLQREFARRFRNIARAAGIPDDVWNMDTRAGAITDAYEKGATAIDAMDLGTHRQLSTNLRYNRGRLKGTSRVSMLRFGDKNDA